MREMLVNLYIEHTGQAEEAVGEAGGALLQRMELCSY